MTDTTLGVKNKTWTLIELTSAGLLAAITLRSTLKEAKKKGGLMEYIQPRGDFWKSSQVYSNVLVTVLLCKGAIDAAKEYNLISGLGAAPVVHPQLGGYSNQNYF